MKRLFPLLLSVVLLISATSTDISNALQVVEEFYRSMQIMARDLNGNAYVDAQERCMQLFQSEVVYYYPNENRFLGDASATNDVGLVGRNFVSSFGRHMNAHPSTFTYKVLSAVPYYEAEWKKSDSKASYVYCFVEKSYSGVTFKDTVLLDRRQRIIGIRNCAGGNAYTNTFTRENTRTTNLQEMEVRASTHYTKKEYDAAYAIYKDILSHDSGNVNANYRLAIMSYKRQGCGNLSKKEADRAAMKYLRKARTSAEKADDYDYVDKIDNVMYYWN